MTLEVVGEMALSDEHYAGFVSHGLRSRDQLRESLVLDESPHANDNRSASEFRDFAVRFEAALVHAIGQTPNSARMGSRACD